MFNLNRIEFFLSAGIIAGLLGVYLLSGFLESKRTEFSDVLEQEELSLQGEKLKGYALGFEGLLADWYWMRSLQYIGDKLYKAKDRQINIENLKPLDPKLLYPLLDNASTLDPNFLAVYSYGATVLPAIDEEKAIEIANKGIRNNPGRWQLYSQLGYIYWKLKDYENASDSYKAGAGIKGAPEWMTAMSARMSSEGGSRETARELYRQLLDNASDSQTRNSAELRLKELDSFDEREVLDQALAEFKDRNGRCASKWNDLLDILKNKTLEKGKSFRADAENNIVDPTDAPYLIDPASCTARLDFTKTGLPRN